MKIGPINNGEELERMRKWRAKFASSAIQLAAEPPPNVDPVLVQAMREGQLSLVAEMDAVIAAYETTRTTPLTQTGTITPPEGEEDA